MRNYTLTILGLIGFSAFKGDGNSSLRITHWDLASIQTSRDGTKRYVNKSKPYLVIKDSIFYGNSGCNDFGGKCSIKNDSIFFNWPAATAIYCPEINWIEDALFDKLMRGKAKYMIDKDTLFLFGKTAYVYRFYKSIDQRKSFNKFSRD